MPQFIVGIEAALQELLERTDRIESSLDTLHDTMTSFESAVDMLVDYALALKAENALLIADDQADDDALAAATAPASAGAFLWRKTQVSRPAR
jgi:exonuclease VII small subunit